MVKTTSLTLLGFDPMQFLCKLDEDAVEPALVRLGAWTVLAWNPSERIAWDKKLHWNELRSLMRKRRQANKADLPFIGGLIGYASYDLGYSLHGIALHAKDELRLPLLSLGIYEQALCFDGSRLIAVGSSAFVKEVEAIHRRPLPDAAIPSITFTPSVTRATYARAIRRIHRAILAGDVYQLNYTYFLRAQADTDLKQLFALLCRRHSSPCAAYLATPETTLLSLSPEEFVSLQRGRLSACPIKGTRPRGRTKSEDLRQRTALLASEKEKTELNMITDLLRNDLGRIAKPGSVVVTERRSVDMLPSVWHTSARIEADIAREYSAVDVLERMLPGGSITGCPKARAMELIDDLEPIRRGPYTGTTVVLSDDGSLHSSILIRTAIARGKRLWVGVGGGIVHASTAAAEYEETIQKAAPFLALAQGQILHWIDGREVGSDDSRLDQLKPDNPRANGVFETLRVERGRIVNCSDHLKRLQRSATLIDLELPMEIPEIYSQLLSTAKSRAWLLGRMKIVCTADHVLIRLQELIIDRAVQECGTAVTFVRLQRKNPEAKALPYNRETAAHRHALQRGFGEALLLDSDGNVREGAYSNLFWVERGVLCTPDEGMLPGITRKKVLRIAKQLKIAVRFSTPSVKQLRSADEIFLTRSTVGIMPVVRIDRHRIADGQPGPVTHRLQRKMRM